MKSKEEMRKTVAAFMEDGSRKADWPLLCRDIAELYEAASSEGASHAESVTFAALEFAMSATEIDDG